MYRYLGEMKIINCHKEYIIFYLFCDSEYIVPKSNVNTLRHLIESSKYIIGREWDLNQWVREKSIWF